MTEIARLNRSSAKFNPRETFTDPYQIVEEVMFTRAEKITALESWRRDILTELTAAGEGMSTHGVSERLSRDLRRVESALRDVAEPEPEIP